MRILVTNLTAAPYSLDIPGHEDEIREVIPLGGTVDIGNRISPYDLNLDLNLRAEVANSRLLVSFLLDSDDLVAPPSVFEAVGLVRIARTVATTNIPLSGLGGLNGVTLQAGNQVLVLGQTDPTENGLYIAAAGAWARAPDADGNDEIQTGMVVTVAEGTFAGRAWVVSTPDPVIIGTTPITFGEYPSEITDGQHGNRGGGLLHALATQALAGFMSSADKTKLDDSAFDVPVRNESGADIPDRQLVAVVNTSAGGLRLIDLADEDDGPRRPALGFTTSLIANNSNGRVHVFGPLDGFDTTSLPETGALVHNDQLALGDDGAFVKPPPGRDSATGEVQLIGWVDRVAAAPDGRIFVVPQGLLPITTDQVFALADGVLPVGVKQPPTLTRAGGLDISTTANRGYVYVGGTEYRRVKWAVATVTTPANSSYFIYIDSSGVLQTATVQPSLTENFVIGTGVSNATDVVFLAPYAMSVDQVNEQLHEYTKLVIGPVSVSGLTVSINAPLGLNVDAGTYFVLNNKKVVSSPTTGATFAYVHRDGSGDPVFITGQTAVDPENYDNAGSLDPVPMLDWKKDLLYVVKTSTSVEFFLVYAQETFSSQGEAEAGNIPATPDFLRQFSCQTFGIVSQQSSGVITSVVDHRIFAGQLTPASTAAPTDHAFLSGLGDDDHPQYQLRSEKGAANGYAGLDGSSTIADATHGNRGGGTLHALATAVASGFMSAADFAKLLALESAGTVRYATIYEAALAATISATFVDAFSGASASPPSDGDYLAIFFGERTATDKNARVEIGVGKNSTTTAVAESEQEFDLSDANRLHTALTIVPLPGLVTSDTIHGVFRLDTGPGSAQLVRRRLLLVKVTQ